jgi:DNA-binding PucR family transcriptional regulator
MGVRVGAVESATTIAMTDPPDEWPESAGEPIASEVLALIRAAAIEMRAQLDAGAELITQAIHDAFPDLPADLYSDTLLNTQANVDAFSALIPDRAAIEGVQPPSQAVDYARAFARSGLGMELLTRIYSHGEHAYRRLWTRQLRSRTTDPELLAEALIQVEELLFSYTAAVTRSLASAHAEELARRSSSVLMLRINEIRNILSGAPIDQLASSQRLRYRLDGSHVGFVLWRDGAVQETEESLDELSRLAAATGEALGATNTLAVPISDVYAGWANVASPTPVASELLPRGVHLAVGLPQRGTDGFCRTHEEALRARRIVDLGHGRQAAVRFDNLALDALLTADLDEAIRFVDRELANLIDGSEARRRIVVTLETFLTEGSNLARTSRLLGVHENTVSYRLHRAEELLGRPLGDRPLELQSALRLARLLAKSA